MTGLDLNQLQAELELKRSALADSILSKLPGLGRSSSSSEPQPNPSSSSRPRQVNLGLGATPKQQSNDSTDSNARPRSAADLRLKGALTSKRKRWQDQELVNRKKGEESEDDQVSRADAIGASKKVKQNANGKAKGSAGVRGNKDAFATKGIEAQKAAQNQPRIVVVDGQQVDLSKLSKTQRKKINKQLKAQSDSTTTDTASSPQQETANAPASPAKSATSIPPNSAPSLPISNITLNNSNSKSGGMTALQAQMLSKLSGSRFRTINEKLYTTPSEQAVQMIDSNPIMFDEYHQGFREQVRGWPKNPLDRIAELFHPTTASAGAKGSKASSSVSKFTKAPKARFTPGALVVDLGAGEGDLAKKLVGRGKGGQKVLCFDLVNTPDGWVRKQDSASIGGLPLPGYFNPASPLGLDAAPEASADGQADVAVFCLSLMGTNWIHMILEAKRVLRTGGELIVAEVTSRFQGGFERFIALVKALGFGLESVDSANTHFVLFEFTKLTQEEHLALLEKEAEVEGMQDPTSVTLQELNEVAKGLLKPCIYKRR